MTNETLENKDIYILEERVISLESRNLFQDDVIEQLSEELAVCLFNAVPCPIFSK